MPTRFEIDIKRLLASCEEIAKDDPGKNWRLKKYLESLGSMLVEIAKLPTKPSKDTLADYNRRYIFLKGLVQTTQLNNPVQKVVAVQHLSHGAATTGNNAATKEIHQKTTAKYSQELKTELFDNEDSLRQRNISKPPVSRNSTNGTEDLDSLMKYHHTMQEKVAENMLSLTRNLKEQTLLASKIIKKDTETMKSSANLADSNLTSLKTEHERLEEQSRKAWKCWLWFMIAFVMFIFFNMVLFMKVTKKGMPV